MLPVYFLLLIINFWFIHIYFPDEVINDFHFSSTYISFCLLMKHYETINLL